MVGAACTNNGGGDPPWTTGSEKKSNPTTSRWFSPALAENRLWDVWGGRTVSNRHLREGIPAHYRSYATPARVVSPLAVEHPRDFSSTPLRTRPHKTATGWVSK